jgi:hypothetical protein
VWIRVIGVPLAAACLVMLVLTGSYRRWERIVSVSVPAGFRSGSADRFPVGAADRADRAKHAGAVDAGWAGSRLI